MVYAQKFIRGNWNQNVSLREEIFVIFETDLPYDDKNIVEFEREIWDALWKQYPIWSCPYDQKWPAPNKVERWRHNWSSPTMEGKVIKLG